MKSIILATLLLGVGGAHADARARITCTPGVLACPPVHATPVPVPRPSVTPAPANAAPKDIFSGLLQFQGDVVAGLQQADTTQAAPINAATGASWNPTAHMCLAGVPQIGTQGQPGYVPASAGLIAWVQGLAPLAASSVPPLPADPSPATLAVYADNQLSAAEGTVNGLLNQINSGGVPTSLQLSCGGFINHVGNEVMTATAQVAGFEALLAKYVMPVVAAHKAPAK